MAVPDQEMRNEAEGRGVQDRLIEAAEELFCTRGFNDTSVRDIAGAADCNVASVNYYFGSKDNLYREIWRRRLVQMRDSRLASIERVMSASGRPVLEDLLRSYATAFLEPLVGQAATCRFVNLMAREMIDPHLPRETFLNEMIVPVMSALSDALIRVCPPLAHCNVRLIVLSIVSQLIHTLCAQGMFEESGHPEVPKLDIEELIDHVVRFSAAGIRAYAAENGEKV